MDEKDHAIMPLIKRLLTPDYILTKDKTRYTALFTLTIIYIIYIYVCMYKEIIKITEYITLYTIKIRTLNFIFFKIFYAEIIFRDSEKMAIMNIFVK